MRNLTLILSLAAALAVTDVTALAQDAEEGPTADDGAGRGRQRRQRRRGRGCDCRNAPRGKGDARGSETPPRGGGNRRGQGGCANVPKPTKPAKPEYLERLQKALASELDARDYYLAAARSLEGVRRFSNLASAEERHAQAIKNVLIAFGAKPAKPAEQPQKKKKKKVKPIAPKTLAEADKHCREIERKVIEFYGKLIADCPDEGIKQVLQRIQAANHRHLKAVGG